MSPEIRDAVISKADQDAARERARIEHIVGYIENNEEALREAFLTEEVDESDMPLFLYNKTTQAIRTVESKLLQSIGVTISHRLISDTGEDTDPLIKLGWMKWYPYNPEKADLPLDRVVAHTYHATEAGREVVDGLRAAQGYVDTHEQRRINDERRKF